MASKLQSDILKYLKSKRHCWCIKVIAANERGCPDILCCFRGRFIAIEVKSLKDTVKPIQLEQINAINMAHGRAIAVWDLMSVQMLFKRLPKNLV